MKKLLITSLGIVVIFLLVLTFLSGELISENSIQNDTSLHCERPIGGNKTCMNSFCEISFSGCGELKCDYQVGWGGGGNAIYLCNDFGFGTCNSDNHTSGSCSCNCFGNYCLSEIFDCFCRVSLCYCKYRIIEPLPTKL